MQSAFESFFSASARTGGLMSLVAPSQQPPPSSADSEIRESLLLLVTQALNRSREFYADWSAEELGQRLAGIAWLHEKKNHEEVLVHLEPQQFFSSSSLDTPAAFDPVLDILPSSFALSPATTSLLSPSIASAAAIATSPVELALPRLLLPLSASPATSRSSRVEWKESDKSNVIAGVEKYGNRWTQICANYSFSPGLTPSKVKSYYFNRLLASRPRPPL